MLIYASNSIKTILCKSLGCHNAKRTVSSLIPENVPVTSNNKKPSVISNVVNPDDINKNTNPTDNNQPINSNDLEIVDSKTVFHLPNSTNNESHYVESNTSSLNKPSVNNTPTLTHEQIHELNATGQKAKEDPNKWGQFSAKNRFNNRKRNKSETDDEMTATSAKGDTRFNVKYINYGAGQTMQVHFKAREIHQVQHNVKGKSILENSASISEKDS